MREREKRKMEKMEKKMEKEKENGKEREKRDREIRAALIAASTAGPVGRAQRPRARADEVTGKRGRGCWRPDVWNRERFRELWFRVLGGF